MNVNLKLALSSITFALLMGCSDDRDSTLDAGQKAAAPVVKALSEFQAKHGRFPVDLGALISEGYIKSIPKMPSTAGTTGVYQLEYQAAPDGSSYYLRFACDFPDGPGPDELRTRYKLSYEAGWKTSSYPPHFETLVADNFGKRFRESDDSESLGIAIRALIATAKRGRGTNCINLPRRQVIECLGPGDPVDLPKNLGEAKGPVEFYESADKIQRYCFTYMLKDNTPFCYDEPHVVDVLYEIRAGDSGEDNWTVVERCK
jgi:hypothetical protein